MEIRMNNTLKTGLNFTFSYKVPGNKTVPHIYSESEEFSSMPTVFATGFMVALIEWACILCIKSYIDWPMEQTVGTHIDVSHCAPTPPGMVVTVEVVLNTIEEKKLIFNVKAKDEIDVISEGIHERFIIDREKFTTRALKKRGKLNNV